jgi:succinoglycan biosynthesis transport protein ExoP
LPTVLVAAFGMLALAVGFALTSELLAAMPTHGAGLGAGLGAAFAPIGAAPMGRGPAPTGPGRRTEHSGPMADRRTPIGVPLDAIEAVGREIAAIGEAARRVTVVGAARNVGTTVTAITLARSLARHGRVVLVDLALENPNLSVITSDPTAPGIAELVRGAATYGEVITRDRHSRVHLVMAGRTPEDAQAVIASQRLSIALEALARSYDYLVIDAGALPEIAAERFAEFAPHAVLIASGLDELATIEVREQLLRAGFTDVGMLASDPIERAAEAGRAQAAA